MANEPITGQGEHTSETGPHGDDEGLPVDAHAALPMSAAELLDAWERMRRGMSATLRESELDAAWVSGFRLLATKMRELVGRNVDAALYVLIQATATELDEYSVQHAMACAVVAELAARWLSCSDAETDALVLAALSMNVSMTVMQDSLARQATAPSDAQRRTIQTHATDSAELLREAGVDDQLWLQVVRGHHTVSADPQVEATAPPGVRLAELLRRIDIYTAKLSRRRGREATTPAIAARDACLDAQGLPDSIGATLLRLLGLYPPGTYVALANGDTAIVVRRGEKAHTPEVASLRRSDGGLLMPPQRRDTAFAQFAVKQGLSTREVRVRLDHARVLAC